MIAYDCDQCGACCEQLIVEAGLEDALREPLIAETARLLNGKGKIPLADACFGLACGKAQPCPFGDRVDGKHVCHIYPTRPGVCVQFQAGSRQCQMAREWAHLPPLQPVEREPTIYVQIQALARGDN